MKHRIVGVRVILVVLFVLLTLEATAVAKGRVWVEPSPKDRKAYINPEYNKALARLAQDSMSAVVSITTSQTMKTFRGRDPFDFFFNLPKRRGSIREGMGSGFLIHPDGYILTNNHVIENTDEIMVKFLDGQELPAEVVGSDPRTDVALIRVQSKTSLPYLKLGDSDALLVGEMVVAIGNPLGLSHTVTQGIVSQKGRKDIAPSGRNIISNFIQTDASINPGNSGGPLVNIYGEVVGINSAVAQGTGIGFAIPINMVKTLMPQLAKGKITRSWIGVQVQKVNEDLAGSVGLDHAMGAMVVSVIPDSPAAKAGLRPEDVILTFEDKPINDWSDLTWYASTYGAGRTVELKIWRDRREESVRVTLGVMPGEEGTPSSGSNAPSGGGERLEILGLSLRAATASELQESGIEAKEGGVVVEGLKPQSRAARSGVREGDLIRSVNGTPVRSVKAVSRALKDARKGSFIRLLINRRGMALLVAFQAD